MKTLQEIQQGDYVAIPSYPGKPPRFQKVTKVTDKTIWIWNRKYDRETGKCRERWVDETLIVPTPEMYDQWKATTQASADKAAARKAFESTEPYKLASQIIGYANCITTDQLSTMPIDQLRQIVQWLDEHKSRL